jgi:hypothetical protein
MGGDPTEIQSFLNAFPDLSPVDTWSIGNLGNPTLPDLLAYDAVILMNNNAFLDPTGLGNVLADYVDAGGGVTTTLASFASWANGLECVAVKNTAVAFNIFVAEPGFWTGDVPLVLYNAALFSSGGAVPWLDEDPKSGTVAAGATLPVDVIFDAGDLEPGDYYAHLIISSNDPDEPEVIVSPIHLKVKTDALIWLPPDVSAPNLAEKADQRGLTIDEVRNVTMFPTSHVELKAALEANGKTAHIKSSISASDLADVTYVFVALGVFPNNHVIKNSDPEAALLESYVAGGGKLYLEGGDVWYYDPKYLNGHDFGSTFRIRALSDGAGDLKPVLGHCFAEDMDFTYEGQNNFIDHIAPRDDDDDDDGDDGDNGSACTIHANDRPAYDCGVAYASPSDYRTIGNAFQFGGLQDNGSSSFTKTDLMAAYLDHFDSAESEKSSCALPEEIVLSQSFPNPFNGQTVIEYALPEAANVRLIIYNTLGQKVRTLLDETQAAGYKRVVWDGSNERGARVSSGIYFYQLEFGQRKLTGKMFLQQ